MISVIVPVYNAEKFIERCVNSIISQTYSDWELFLIDDGSKDNSLKKIKEYEQKDERITAIHQDNQGAGAARNKGLEFASGNYVVFIDSDDYIEENYFELLSKHNEDVVFIDVNRRNENGEITARERLSAYKGTDKDDILRGQMTGKILWGGVRKAVKRELLEEHHIRYSNLKVGEEAIYSFQLLYYAESISFIETAVYNYEVHAGSLSQTVQDDPWGPVAIALKEKVITMGCYEDYANTLNAFIITSSIVSLSKMALSLRFRNFEKKSKQRMKIAYSLVDLRYGIDFRNMNNKAKLLYPWIKTRQYWAVYIIARLR